MASSTSPQLSLTWQKAQALSVIAASLAVPLIVAVVGNSFSKSQKQEELGVRYVELAVGILRAEPNKESKALRGWAISVVDHFSPVPLPAAAKTELELQQLLIELQLQLTMQKTVRRDAAPERRSQALAR